MGGGPAGPATCKSTTRGSVQRAPILILHPSQPQTPAGADGPPAKAAQNGRGPPSRAPARRAAGPVSHRAHARRASLRSWAPWLRPRRSTAGTRRQRPARVWCEGLERRYGVGWGHLSGRLVAATRTGAVSVRRRGTRRTALRLACSGLPLVLVMTRSCRLARERTTPSQNSGRSSWQQMMAEVEKAMRTPPKDFSDTTCALPSGPVRQCLSWRQPSYIPGRRRSHMMLPSNFRSAF